jgi:hypothetical protein
MYNVVKATLVVGAFAGGSALTPSSAQDASPTQVRIASNYVRADGCHDSTQTFMTQVPNIDRLDRSYHGVLDGIEVVEISANNGHAYRNFTWVNNGTAITYQLYAKGAGYWVDPPKVFGTTIGGGYCHKAGGGSEGVNIIAHYIK